MAEAPKPEDNANKVVAKAKSFYYQGNRNGVLLLHGFAGSVHDLRQLGWFLNSKGFTVHGKRLHGHGINKETFTRSSGKDWIRSVDQGIALLEKRCNKIFIIGHSMGGSLAMLASIKHPSVKKLVIMGTPIRIRGHWWKRLIVPIILPFHKYYHKVWIKTEHERQQHIESGSYLQVSLKALMSAMALFSKTKREIKNVKIPILLIYSKNDRVIRPDSPDFIYKNIGSNNKRLLWIDGHFHQPHNSVRRNQIHAQILGFFISRSS
ncbi:MAG: alpha/beta fold hydrolase [Patescibacteria group bacterium]